MSTRSQLRFVKCTDYGTDHNDTGPPTRIAQVYRHADGYPSAVLPSLARLKALQDTTGTERGPESVAVNYVFLNKLRGMGFYLRRRSDGFGGSLHRADVVGAIEHGDLSGLATLDHPHFLLGYGVEDPSTGIHGDEEYLYVIELPTGTGIGGIPDWTVKVSEHVGFPRGDGPTEEAFDWASWQFDGPLSSALEELVG